MSRALKFRVFFYDGDDYSTGEMMTAFEAIREGYIEFEEDGSLREVDSCAVLMQFTGRNDVNGREIYEGDIVIVTRNVKGKKQRYVIEWTDDGTSFRAVNRLSGALFLFDCASRLEVIGNIYENPELLEDK